jgi:hypothetical protein
MLSALAGRSSHVNGMRARFILGKLICACFMGAFVVAHRSPSDRMDSFRAPRSQR